MKFSISFHCGTVTGTSWAYHYGRSFELSSKCYLVIFAFQISKSLIHTQNSYPVLAISNQNKTLIGLLYHIYFILCYKSLIIFGQILKIPTIVLSLPKYPVCNRTTAIAARKPYHNRAAFVNSTRNYTFSAIFNQTNNNHAQHNGRKGFEIEMSD